MKGDSVGLLNLGGAYRGLSLPGMLGVPSADSPIPNEENNFNNIVIVLRKSPYGPQIRKD